MAEKNIFGRTVESLLKRFSAPGNKATTENVGSLIGPVFREVPPDSNQQQIITEGLKGWSYVAVSAIADEVATNPLYLYVRRGKDWTIKDDHPALDLIHKPNQYQTGEEMLWLTVGYLLCVGEALWILNKEKNPDQMILFNPAKATPIFDDTTHTIGSYKIQLANGKFEIKPASQCIFMKLPSFSNPFRGTGVMEYITKAIDIDNFVQDFTRIFFYNSAMPHGVLQTDQEITLDHGRQILRAFDTKHRGVKNAHRTALLDKGLKFTNIDYNFQQLEMAGLDLRIMNRVLSAFKVPKSVLGISEDVNRANADAASYTFAKRAVMPKLKMLEAQLNQYLLPKFSDGQNLWFEFENPVTQDALVQAQVEEIRIRSGVRTADEYRAEDGLEPLPEKPAQPEALQLAFEKKEQKKLNDRINSHKVLTSREKTLRIFEEKMFDEAKKLVEKKYGQKINTGPYTKEAIAEYHNKKVENSDKIEKDFVERVQSNMFRQKKMVLDQLAGKSKKQRARIEIAFNEEEEAAILASISVPYVERSILAQAALTAAILDIENTLDTQDNRVRNFIKRWTAKLGKSNAETTNTAIQNTLSKWAETDDGSIADLKKSLGEYFDSPAPAERIARTEVSRASGYATQTIYQDAGAVGKKWIAAFDERTCPICDDLDGKTVDLAGFFDTIEGDSIQHEPAHPNCRCDITPVFETGKSIEVARKSFDKMTQMMHVDKYEKSEDKKNIGEREDELLNREKAISIREKELSDREKNIDKEVEDTIEEIKRLEKL